MNCHINVTESKTLSSNTHAENEQACIHKKLKTFKIASNETYEGQRFEQHEIKYKTRSHYLMTKEDMPLGGNNLAMVLTL